MSRHYGPEPKPTLVDYIIVFGLILFVLGGLFGPLVAEYIRKWL